MASIKPVFFMYLDSFLSSLRMKRVMQHIPLVFFEIECSQRTFK